MSAMMSSGAFPKVALRKPPMPGPGVLRRVLGRLSDEPREGDERDRREHELRGLREVGRRSGGAITRGASATAAKRALLTTALKPRLSAHRRHCLKTAVLSSLAGSGSSGTQSDHERGCGDDRAPASGPRRSRVPPLRRSLREGRPPGRVPQHGLPVRLRVRGLGPHVHGLSAEGLRRRDRPRAPRGGGGGARRLRRRSGRRAPLPMCEVEVVRATGAARTSSAAGTPSSTSSRASARASACSRAVTDETTS